MPVVGLLQALVEAFTALAHAAEVPPEVRVSREERRRAEQIRLGVFHLVDDLQAAARDASAIEGLLDTAHERRLAVLADKSLAKAAGWRAKLIVLGVPEASLPTLPASGTQESP